MRGLIGFLILALILSVMHDRAEARAELRCQPVHVEEPETCSLGLYLKRGVVPNRCKTA